jgi:hypothetical protein
MTLLLLTGAALLTAAGAAGYTLGLSRQVREVAALTASRDQWQTMARRWRDDVGQVLDGQALGDDTIAMLGEGDR